MTFYYNFYGTTMSCVVVYVQRSDGTERVVWLKSGHWGDRWIKTQVETSDKTAEYRVIVEGIKGSSYFGDAALDEFRFTSGSCTQDPSVFHVVSKKEENNEIFRVHLLPPHDEWRHVFAFKADQIQRSENDTILFVYPPSSTGNHIISTALYINSSERFPTDFFIARRNEVTTNIFEVHSGYNFSNKITISNQSTDCCPTVWETTIPIFLLPESKESCYPGWKAVGSSCLRFFVSTRRTWDGARASCRQQGGDLALLDKSTSFTNDLIKLLISMTNSETDFFVGFRRTSVKWRPDIWMWNDGKHVDEEQWKGGYPLNSDDNLCGALSTDDMKLLNVDCNHMNGFICESFEVNMFKYGTWSYGQFQGQETRFSSVFQKDITSPRWIISLVKRISVFTVVVDFFVNCCGQLAESVTLLVVDGDMSYSECEESRTSYDLSTLILQCTPPRRGKSVILEFLSQSWTPSASSVAVSGFDSVVETHGVRRKLWYRYVNTEGFATLRENPIFEQPPDGYSTTFNMSATFEVSENYGESLTSYLQVPESGNYIFSLSCGDECELWFKEFEERELSFKQTAASNSMKDEIMLVQLRRWANYNEPDR